MTDSLIDSIIDEIQPYLSLTVSLEMLRNRLAEIILKHIAAPDSCEDAFYAWAEKNLPQNARGIYYCGEEDDPMLVWEAAWDTVGIYTNSPVRKQAEDECIQTVAPDVVERVAKTLYQYNGQTDYDWQTLPKDMPEYHQWYLNLAKAAIAAMGDASDRKTEGSIGANESTASPTTSPDNHSEDTLDMGGCVINRTPDVEVPSSPANHSEISDNEEALIEKMVRVHHNYTEDSHLFSGDIEMMRKTFNLIRPYLRTTEPVSVSLEKLADALFQSVYEMPMTEENCTEVGAWPSIYKQHVKAVLVAAGVRYE